MGAATVVEHSGKQVLVIDLAHADLEGVVEVVRQAKSLIIDGKLRDVLTLTDVTGTEVTSSVVKVLRDFVAHNEPYVRAGAVVGLDRVRAMEFMAIVKFSGRNLKAFTDRAKAMDWLEAQPDGSR